MQVYVREGERERERERDRECVRVRASTIAYASVTVSWGAAHQLAQRSGRLRLDNFPIRARTTEETK